MLKGLYERTRVKLTKSLTKCENRNTVLCRELFDSLTLHPQQELYETIRIHDLIFNEIDLVAETVTEFLRKMDVLHEKLRTELTLQQERNAVKR
jgi:phosphoglycerate-specific signal transduction histidine kinase